jgi:hypothetical protein
MLAFTVYGWGWMRMDGWMEMDGDGWRWRKKDICEQVNSTTQEDEVNSMSAMNGHEIAGNSGHRHSI